MRKILTRISFNLQLFYEETISATKLLFNQKVGFTKISEVLTIFIYNYFYSSLIFNFAL